MMPEDLRSDALLEALAALPVLDLAAARAASLRARCHAVLERRSKKQGFADFLASDFFRRVLEPALVGGASAVYLAEVVWRAAAVFGL
jgi:hypothetical protein